MDTRRRSLLKGGGILVATAWAAGCGGSDTSGATLQSPPPPPGSSPPASPPPATAFFAIPSLQDERATYDLLGWTRTVSDEAFTFTSTASLPANIDIHGDTEGDDLWTWRQQKARGYSGTHAEAAKVSSWNAAWLQYFKNGYLADHGAIGAGGTDYGLGWDHTYGPGLLLCYVLDGDTAALAAAETVGDRIIWKVSTNRNDLTVPSPPNPSTQKVWPREFPRWSILFTYLAQATGAAKWIFWRDALLNCFAQSPSWVESPAQSIVQGGHYFADRDTAISNWNGTYDPNPTVAAAIYDGGRRVNNAFYYGLLGEAVYRGYLATGRSDLRDKLIKMARFIQYYGHIPSHTVPLVGNYFGADITNGNAAGGRWHKSPNHQDNSAVAAYDGSLVNTLVWGYKLTGDNALLTMARLCLRQCNRWTEGAPGATHVAPLVPANEVYKFIDVQKNGGDGVENWQFENNKGQLQYCYQIFENGGMPARVA